jgi:hypothetical protein
MSKPRTRGPSTAALIEQLVAVSLELGRRTAKPARTKQRAKPRQPVGVDPATIAAVHRLQARLQVVPQ